MRNALLLIVAIVIAGTSAMLARSWLADQRAALIAAQPKAAPAPTAQSLVLVAKTDLRPGQFVQADQLRWQPWPAEAIASAHVVQGKRPDTDFVGAVARVPVLAGEPVTDARFVKPGDRGFLAAVLEPGMRAITVPINATSGNAGFVFPGDRVDLILTSHVENEGERGKHQFADTVLEAVRVLAIDQRVSKEGSDAAPGKTATLEATPQMAEKIALALQVGTLSLSLRSFGGGSELTEGPFEPEKGPTPTLDREFYAGAPTARPPADGIAREPRKPTVLVLRGAAATEVKF